MTIRLVANSYLEHTKQSTNFAYSGEFVGTAAGRFPSQAHHSQSDTAGFLCFRTSDVDK